MLVRLYKHTTTPAANPPIEKFSSGDLPVSENFGRTQAFAAINFFFTSMEFAKGFPVWKWWESRNRAAQLHTPPLPTVQIQQLPPQLPTVQLKLQPSAASQLEEQPSLPTVRQSNNNGDDQNPNFVDYVMKMQWALLVIGVCIAAFSAPLQALRTPAPLPPTFHWFCMLLELAFLALLVSVYIRRRYKMASLVMAHVAIFLGTTAFMLAIAVTLPAPLMGISIALYIVAILAIIFANR